MEKKVIIITGCSSGIGLSFVKSIASRRDLICIGISRRDPKLANIRNFTYYKADVTDRKRISELVKKIIKQYKRIDILINNAGMGIRGTIEDLREKDIMKIFNTNFFGYVRFIQEVLPYMRKMNRGHIINVGALGAKLNTPSIGYYAISKNAVHSLTEILSKEIEGWDINISLVIPGAVKSNFGKRIINGLDIDKSDYRNIYKEWDNRFRNYFKKRNTAETAAQKILEIIDKPKFYQFISPRDKYIYVLKSILPNNIADWFIYKYFFKNEKT